MPLLYLNNGNQSTVNFTVDGNGIAIGPESKLALTGINLELAENTYKTAGPSYVSFALTSTEDPDIGPQIRSNRVTIPAGTYTQEDILGLINVGINKAMLYYDYENSEFLFTGGETPKVQFYVGDTTTDNPQPEDMTLNSKWTFTGNNLYRIDDQPDAPDDSDFAMHNKIFIRGTGTINYTDNDTLAVPFEWNSVDNLWNIYDGFQINTANFYAEGNNIHKLMYIVDTNYYPPPTDDNGLLITGLTSDGTGNVQTITTSYDATADIPNGTIMLVCSSLESQFSSKIIGLVSSGTQDIFNNMAFGYAYFNSANPFDYDAGMLYVKESKDSAWRSTGYPVGVLGAGDVFRDVPLSIQLSEGLLYFLSPDHIHQDIGSISEMPYTYGEYMPVFFCDKADSGFSDLSDYISPFANSQTDLRYYIADNPELNATSYSMLGAGPTYTLYFDFGTTSLMRFLGFVGGSSYGSTIEVSDKDVDRLIKISATIPCYYSIPDFVRVELAGLPFHSYMSQAVGSTRKSSLAQCQVIYQFSPLASTGITRNIISPSIPNPIYIDIANTSPKVLSQLTIRLTDTSGNLLPEQAGTNITLNIV